MAASSSSSSSSSAAISAKKYDVFISFRGEDTRSNFVSHLHEALDRNNIETYIDYRLEKGDEVWPSLEKAIQDSILFLIVFSENYASSTWCLNELIEILECSKDQEEHHVIPVFYNIDPSHIRKQTGTYKEAFTKHEQSSNKHLVPKWKAALTQAANLSGWDSTASRNEAKLIEEIVKGVLKKLDNMDHMDQSVHSDGIVGIHEQIAHVKSMLKCIESQDVRFIGIWGMGGIGKTTIAKVLFNELCFEFQSCCFLANVREESEKKGMAHLIHKLLSTLLESRESYIGMPDGGSTYARRRLSRKKVLIVLDDVNDSDQLRNLAGARHWFGQGSRVIITTRDKQVLGKNVDDTYKVKALRSDKALQLFKLNAFENSCFDEEFENLSWKVVEYAKGIPLALIVLGCFLCGKDKDEWKSELEKLKRMPDKKIQKILKLSYQGLDREEKTIFLFVACLFKGKELEHTKTLLDACGYSTAIGLKTLQNKALLTIDEVELSMHDLIHEMALEIVREESLEDPGKRSRLWDANEIRRVLQNNKGSEAIKSISLDMSKIDEELYLSPQVFANMLNLMFLEMYNSNDSQRQRLYLPQGLEYLPTELRYLYWDNYPLKSLPLTFSAEKLVELYMPHSGMTTLWDGVQNVVNLKRVNLFGCEKLVELPDFSRAINLKRVSLRYCSSIREVHPSILSLNKLESLVLDYCVALTGLKSDHQPRSLDSLSLIGCSNLKEFSITPKNMTTLNLGGTAINELPSCIGSLSKLEYLLLYNCKSMKNIQSNLFDGLHALRWLVLKDCGNISEFVNRISLLSSLKTLIFEESAIKSLSASIKHCSSLEELEFKKCTRLQYLPQLPLSLTSIKAFDCPSLQTVQFTSPDAEADDSFGGYKSVTRFQNCVRLDEHSILAILAYAMVKFNKLLANNTISNCEDHYYDKPRVIYSGSHVPKWFKYKAPQASMIVDLSCAPLSLDWGLLYCIVITPCPPGENIWIDCDSCIKIINDEGGNDDGDGDDEDEEIEFLKTYGSAYRVDERNFTSDHVYLWCDGALSYRINRLRECRGTSNSKISVELNFCYYVYDGEQRQREEIEIKECGACPTYAWEYQNFINEMEKESHAGTSYSYCNKDEDEAVPPMQKSKALIFPRLPSATTWKNETQGLKDIFNL